MSHDMAHKVIPFPPEQRPPIFTRRWRTIVDVNGTRNALDVTASYAVLPSGRAGSRAATETTGNSGSGTHGGTAVHALRDNNGPRVEIESQQSRMSIHLRGGSI